MATVTFRSKMDEEIDKILFQYDFDIPLDDIDVHSALRPALHSDDPRPLALDFEEAPQPHPLLSVPTSSSSRFAELKSDNDIEQAKASSVPKNTKKSTDWAVNIWKDGSVHKRSVCSSYAEWPIHLFIAQPQELNYWLSKFVLEAVIQDSQSITSTLSSMHVHTLPLPPKPTSTFQAALPSPSTTKRTSYVLRQYLPYSISYRTPSMRYRAMYNHAILALFSYYIHTCAILTFIVLLGMCMLIKYTASEIGV